ncbi:MAG: protein-export chaperone SecB [Pseudomonadota bacterium]
MVTPHFEIQRQYVKDMSYESFIGPALFTATWAPGIEVDVASRDTALGEEDRYEVELIVTVKVSLNDKPAYLIEVTQAGIFQIRGFTQDELSQTLGIMCPTFLYPYAREAVDNIATKAGAIPVGLQPIDFESMYLDKQAAGKVA